MKKNWKWQPTFSLQNLRTQNWVLPSLILGAIFLHGMAFYLIQTSGPEAAKTTPPAARLSVLDYRNPRDKAALEWIENHDPAVVVKQSEPPSPPLAGVRYVPSYEKNLPRPLPIPDEVEGNRRPTLFPPGPVPEVRTRDPEKSVPVVLLRSQVVCSPSVTLQNQPVFSPPISKDQTLIPARFFVVSISKEASPALFLLQSSQDEALDKYSRDWLQKTLISFAPEQNSGWISIYWGSEVWDIEKS